jgi:tetratricopeptide (TPR) repeat protein
MYEVAEATKIPSRTLQNYCHGRTVIPRYRLEALAEFLECSPAALLGERGSTQQASTPQEVNRAPVTQQVTRLKKGERAPSAPQGTNELALLVETELPSWSMAEGTKDCPVLLGEGAARLMQIVLRWHGRALHCETLQRVLNQELERWKTMMINPQPEALISRRAVLTAIVALPQAMAPAILQGPRSSRVFEEFLPACTASLTACWHWMRGDGLSIVAEQLPNYLPALEMLAQQPSRYQKTAAQLAAQGCLLMGLIAYHQVNMPLREKLCRRAAHYSHIAKDQTLSVYALGHLADTLNLENRPTEELRLCEQMLTIIAAHDNQITPFLKSKVFIEAAASYAQYGHVQSALRCLHLAHEVFPHQPQNEPVYLLTDHGPDKIIQFAGLTYDHLGKSALDRGTPRRSRVLYTAAQTTFTQLGQLDATAMIRERTRVKILNQQAATAIAQADLETFQAYLQAGVEGAKALGSEKRKQEAIANWKAARLRWPHEKRLLEWAELLMD